MVKKATGKFLNGQGVDGKKVTLLLLYNLSIVTSIAFNEQDTGVYIHLRVPQFNIRRLFNLNILLLMPASVITLLIRDRIISLSNSEIRFTRSDTIGHFEFPSPGRKSFRHHNSNLAFPGYWVYYPP
jgi:hypothetical protein